MSRRRGVRSRRVVSERREGARILIREYERVSARLVRALRANDSSETLAALVSLRGFADAGIAHHVADTPSPGEQVAPLAALPRKRSERRRWLGLPLRRLRSLLLSPLIAKARRETAANTCDAAIGDRTAALGTTRKAILGQPGKPFASRDRSGAERA